MMRRVIFPIHSALQSLLKVLNTSANTEILRKVGAANSLFAGPLVATVPRIG